VTEVTKELIFVFLLAKRLKNIRRINKLAKPIRAPARNFKDLLLQKVLPGRIEARQAMAETKQIKNEQTRTDASRSSKSVKFRGSCPITDDWARCLEEMLEPKLPADEERSS
jgi:hypothetical protein